MIISIAFLGWIGFFLYEAYSATPDQIKTVPYVPQRLVSLEMARKDIEGLFQTGVLLLAGLWGVGIVKKDDRLHLRDWPEIVMFAVATILLVAFLFVDQQYGQLLERTFWDLQQSMDKDKIFVDLFNSPYIRLHYNSLFLCFYGALATTAIAAFSVCLLRGD